MIIFLLAVFIRLIGNYFVEATILHKPFIVSGEAFYKDRTPTTDTLNYKYTAKSLIEGHGYAVRFTDWEEAQADQNSRYPVEKYPWLNALFVKDADGYFKHKQVPPVYPLFLAVSLLLFGISTFSYFIPQVLLGGLSSVLVYLITKKKFNEKIAILAGLITALYPELIFTSYMVRVELLFIFLLLSCFWLLQGDYSKKNLYLAGLTGAILGLAVLTRLTLLFFVPIIFIWEYFCSGEKKAAKIKYLFILFVSFLFVLLPWAIRNYMVFGSFTIMTDEVGTIVTKIPLSEYNNSISTAPSYLLVWIKMILIDPIDFLKESFYRFVLYLSPFTSYMNFSAKLLKGLSWLFVFPASFLGMVLAAKRYWVSSGLIILFILYYILMHSMSFVDRGLTYRYPILPFLSIFSAYGYWYIYDRFKQRKRGNK